MTHSAESPLRSAVAARDAQRRASEGKQSEVVRQKEVFDEQLRTLLTEFLAQVDSTHALPIYSGTRGNSVCADGWVLTGGRRVKVQSWDEGSAWGHGYRPGRDGYQALALGKDGHLWVIVNDSGRIIGRQPATEASGDRVYVGPLAPGAQQFDNIVEYLDTADPRSAIQSIATRLAAYL